MVIKDQKGTTMLRPILWATIAVTTVFAKGDFVVLHSPENVQFMGKAEIDQSLLKDVFATVLGFTIKHGSNWSGVRIGPPFDLPEAVVVVVVEGVEHLESRNGKIFPLNDDEVEEITWQAVSGTVLERSNDNSLVRMRLADGLDALGQSALGALKPTPIDSSSLKSLSLKNEDDRKILEEIKLLDAIKRNVDSDVSANGKPDVYWLVVSGMRQLIDFHGKDGPAVKEALALLNDALSNVTKAFMEGYRNKVVIAAYTNDASKVRNTRAIDLSREDGARVKMDDIGKSVKAPENTSSTPVIDSFKNDDDDDDEEEIGEKNEDEEAKTRTSDEGGSFKKSDESPSITESYREGKNENTGTEANEANEANEAGESSTVKPSVELEDTTRNNEQSNTDTENTNRSSKIADLKHAKRYSDNYPVIFNIFLWFGVVFFFSLLAICVTIADMDPGRDSIIYRMTSTRMKKDN